MNINKINPILNSLTEQMQKSASGGGGSKVAFAAVDLKFGNKDIYSVVAENNNIRLFKDSYELPLLKDVVRKAQYYYGKFTKKLVGIDGNPANATFFNLGNDFSVYEIKYLGGLVKNIKRNGKTIFHNRPQVHIKYGKDDSLVGFRAKGFSAFMRQKPDGTSIVTETKNGKPVFSTRREFTQEGFINTRKRRVDIDNNTAVRLKMNENNEIDSFAGFEVENKGVAVLAKENGEFELRDGKVAIYKTPVGVYRIEKTYNDGTILKKDLNLDGSDCEELKL